MSKQAEIVAARHRAIRVLCAWLGGGASLLVLLIAYALPRSAPRLESASSTEKSARITVTASLPAPLEPGSAVMASFPGQGLTVAGKMLPGQVAGKLVVEFEVPSNLTPGSIEMWSESPSGRSYRWHRDGGRQDELGPPTTAENGPGQAPRDVSQYRYPQATAKAASGKVLSPLPKGVKLPENVRLPNPARIQQLQEKYAQRRQ